VPSPEAVQEVKTQTALYDAQYGHGNGTVSNTVLRSGSNRYHGSAYYVFRNTYLDANTHERVPTQNAAVNPTHRVNDQWTQPGDGHDKTFFMAAYEYVQLHQPVPFSGLVLTTAQAAGDFSGLCSNFIAGVCAPGAGVQLYDPTTADASGNRTPFLNNNIKSKINPAGAALASYYPAPNSNLSPTVNYISNVTSSPNKYWPFVTRVDHSFSDRNKLNATFFKAVLHQIQPTEGFPKQIAPTGVGYYIIAAPGTPIFTSSAIRTRKRYRRWSLCESRPDSLRSSTLLPERSTRRYSSPRLPTIVPACHSRSSRTAPFLFCFAARRRRIM
jgi:hypothetical protein